jgi:hypothetical protein
MIASLGCLMKKTVIVAAMAALVAGCTQSIDEMSYSQRQKYVASMADKCRKEGVSDAEMTACVQQEVSADQSRRMRQKRVGAAIAGASQAYGNSLQANRPVNCTSTGYGNMVRTTCY